MLVVIAAAMVGGASEWQRFTSGEYDAQYPEVAVARNWIDSDPDALECTPRKWHRDLPWFWFLHGPEVVCPGLRRVGEVFDGGKWVCWVPKDPCVVYSFGSDGKTMFENAMAHCDVHVFDPTVSRPRSLSDGVKFHPWGLGAESGTFAIGSVPNATVKTLNGVMRALQHTTIDILKIDVDGHEYGILETVASSFKGFQAAAMLLIEFHWQGAPRTAALFEQLRRYGFVPAYRETNLFYTAQPAAGMEYTFVRKSNVA